MSNHLVLAVDDERAMLKLVQISLENSGYDIVSFDNPYDALEALHDGLHPDVIISDIQMPQLDGYSFYEAAREINEIKGVPFLFLTALDARKDVRKGMTLGADDYLTKPFTKAELIESVAVRLTRVNELRNPVRGSVEATALGAPIIERDNQRLDWDSLKALELLFFLLENRSGVTTYEVAEALWPGKTESKASSSFHTTLYRLRKVMGGELIESVNRRYYLHSKFKINYDADSYRELTVKAKSTKNIAMYERAIALYKGPYLKSFDSVWVEEIRHVLETEQSALLYSAAEAALKYNDLEKATRFFQLMTEHDPYSFDAVEGLAKVWEMRGNNAKAIEARAQFEELMAEEVW